MLVQLKNHHKVFARYTITGVINTLFGLFIIYIMKFSGYGDVVSNFVGYSLGMMVSYKLNSSWTFSFKGSHYFTFVKFLFVTLLAYILNLGVVMYAIKELAINAYLSQAFGVIPYVFITYVGYKNFVFTYAGLKK